jgi:hypothetical protein
VTNHAICASVTAAVVGLCLPKAVQAEAQTKTSDIAGVYRCEPQPSPCPWPEQTISIMPAAISQSSDRTPYVTGGLPWNRVEIIPSDRSIGWPDQDGDDQ